MKRGLFILMLLLVACAQNVPEPIDYSPAFRTPVQSSVVVQHEPEQKLDPYVTLVRTFVENQNCDSVDSYLAGLRKNIQLSSGFMKEFLLLEENIFSERKEMAEEWLSLYEKGKDVISDKELTVAEKHMRDDIYSLTRMSMKIDLHSVERVNGDSSEIPVKVTFTELANLPDRKTKREGEEIYFVHDDNGHLTISDLSIENVLISKMSLKGFEFKMRNDVERERELLDWFRRTVGLAT